MPDFNAVDISETALYDFDHEVLETLLRVENPGGGDHVTRSAFDPL